MALLFTYLLFSRLSLRTTMHTFKLCHLITFFLIFLSSSLGVESRCMGSATIRMYSWPPCWVKSFNFLISSFQIIFVSFSFLKSPSPKFTVNFQNSENSHVSLLKRILSLITLQSVLLRGLMIPLCRAALCVSSNKFENNFKLLWVRIRIQKSILAIN